MTDGRLLLLRTPPRFLFFFLVLAGGILCRDSIAYKGAIGTSVDVGYANLPTRNIYSPKSAHGWMGRLRAFIGITDAIGFELAISTSSFAGYDPQLRIDSSDEHGEPEIVSLARIERIETRQMSAGVMYAVDIYRIIPYFSIGITKLKTGILNVNNGVPFEDLSAYADAALDYQISKHFWCGVVGTYQLSITSESPFDGHMGALFRFSYVWWLKKLESKRQQR